MKMFQKMVKIGEDWWTHCWSILNGFFSRQSRLKGGTGDLQRLPKSIHRSMVDTSSDMCQGYPRIACCIYQSLLDCFLLTHVLAVSLLMQGIQSMPQASRVSNILVHNIKCPTSCLNGILSVIKHDITITYHNHIRFFSHKFHMFHDISWSCSVAMIIAATNWASMAASADQSWWIWNMLPSQCIWNNDTHSSLAPLDRSDVLTSKVWQPFVTLSFSTSQLPTSNGCHDNITRLGSGFWADWKCS